MFDTHYYSRASGATNVSVDITEKRAPTDQSVALLKEMERAAEEKWKGGIRLEGCPFDAILHHHHDSKSAEDCFAVFYKIGSQRREVRFEVREPLFGTHDNTDKIIESAIEAVSRDVACAILEKPLSNAIRSMRFRQAQRALPPIRQAEQ